MLCYDALEHISLVHNKTVCFTPHSLNSIGDGQFKKKYSIII